MTDLARRVAAAEARAGVGRRERLVVRRQPDGIQGALLAAWEGMEAAQGIAPALTVIIRKFVPWPPRTADDVRNCFAATLCDTPADLATRVRAVPAYAEQGEVLSLIGAAS